ncbi:hypothetical protein PIB30_105825, partial [Stylosanthes scabra]|nr:hypothetical protein [Stylosanthes scabra]
IQSPCTKEEPQLQEQIKTLLNVTVVAKLDISNQIVQRLKKKIRRKDSRRRRHTSHGRMKKRANNPTKMKTLTYASWQKEMR